MTYTVISAERVKRACDAALEHVKERRRKLTEDHAKRRLRWWECAAEVQRDYEWSLACCGWKAEAAAARLSAAAKMSASGSVHVSSEDCEFLLSYERVPS